MYIMYEDRLILILITTIILMYKLNRIVFLKYITFEWHSRDIYLFMWVWLYISIIFHVKRVVTLHIISSDFVSVLLLLTLCSIPVLCDCGS